MKHLGRSKRKGIQRDTGNPLGVMDMFINMIDMMAYRVLYIDKTYQIIHVKCMWFKVYQLYLNKLLEKNNLLFIRSLLDSLVHSL